MDLTRFAPLSETALLDWIRSRISRLMIEQIARNDRGEDWERHLAAIQKLFAPAASWGMLTWHPREVLELERWSNVESEAEHIKRLFACAILLRVAAHLLPDTKDPDEEFLLETSAATAIQLVRSAIFLGDEAVGLATRFLAWVYERQSAPILRPFVAFGVLLLLASGADRPVPRQSNRRRSKKPRARPTPADLAELYAWVDREERAAREILGRSVHSDRWLLGLSLQEDNRENRERWLTPARDLLDGQLAEKLLIPK